MRNIFRRCCTGRIQVNDLIQTNTIDNGVIFARQFFEYTLTKTWNGTAWVVRPLRIGLGSVFIFKPSKIWNGSTWQ